MGGGVWASQESGPTPSPSPAFGEGVMARLDVLDQSCDGTASREGDERGSTFLNFPVNDANYSGGGGRNNFKIWQQKKKNLAVFFFVFFVISAAPGWFLNRSRCLLHYYYFF